MAKTTCDWTVERLPWWANGTLDEGEAERVATHLEECATCREELAATRHAMALQSVHLPIETLLDLVEDGAAASFRTDDGEELSRAAVDAHLGHCASCREELALLRESRAALEAEPEEAGKVTAFAPRRPAEATAGGRNRGLDRRRLALAASLVAAFVAAFGWLATGLTAERRGDRLAELERRLAAAEAAAGETAGEATPGAAGDGEPAPADTEPEGGAAAEIESYERRIAELEEALARRAAEPPAGERVAGLLSEGRLMPWNVTVLRSGERPAAPQPERVSAGQGEVALVVFAEGEGPLRVAIEDAGGRTIATLGGLRPESDHGMPSHVVVNLPVGEMAPGTYRLRLLDGEDEVAARSLIVEP